MKESFLNYAAFHSNSSKVICNKLVLNKTKTIKEPGMMLLTVICITITNIDY